MDRATELAMVAALKRGDLSAFDAIYEEFRPRVFTFALRLTGRRDAAEEIAQETWMRLATRVGTLRDETPLGPWLFAVTRNLCISAWRAGARGLAFDPDNDAQNVPDAGRPSPLENAEAGELHRRLEHALARLPADHREVLLLVGVEGLTPSEAASVCGVSAGALRKRLQRARERLAAELGDARASAVSAREACHEPAVPRR